MRNNQKPYYLILVLILIAGFCLRFWDYWHIPFMFDELSAMGRTTYGNFADLINFGVVERDSHPAGVQVFLYYWVSLVGDSEPLVKLPFLLAGLASIWLSFRIGELWFGKTTAILTAAFVSSLQLFVMYSQIARPYISGLFVSLYMVYYWSLYFFKKPSTKYLIGFALFGALAAYNHYFSLLFATTVGLSGLLFVNRKTVLPYMLSGVAILLLYIPHLEIIFAQAEKGTIGGWLGEPGQLFMIKFVYWLFHKSWLSLGLFVAIMVAGIVSGEKIGYYLPAKKRWVLFLWLLPAPVFGYIYSYSVEPILQNSLLIFTTPFAFILLFSFFGELDWKKLGVAVILILLVNSLTLIFVRNYYNVFYKQPFQHMGESAVQLDHEYPGEVFLLNHYIPYFTEYYLEKYERQNIPFSSTKNADMTLVKFDSIVKSVEQNFVIASGLDDQYFQVIKHHFPNWVGYENGFTFEEYTFARQLPSGMLTIERKQVTAFDFNEKSDGWEYSDNLVLFDSLENQKVLVLEKQVEWGPKYTFPLSQISTSGYIMIDIEVDVLPLGDTCELVLVAEIKRDNERLSWRGFNFGDFQFEKGKWQKFYATLDVQKALNNNMDVTGCEVVIFLWNKNKNYVKLKDINISTRPGNKDRYAL